VRAGRHVATALVALILLTACSDDGDRTDGEAAEARDTLIVFSTEGNNLDAYEPDAPYDKQTVIATVADDPDGLDINGQLCFFPDDPHRLITGEDTGQPERTPGWAIFEVDGERVGELSARPVARLVPTYQDNAENPENYGCGVLSDGRVVTTDVGNQVEGPGSGQLIVWFPPFDSTDVDYCKLDVALPTAGGIHVDQDDHIYLTTARPPDNGVVRYTGPYPTSADIPGGCGRTDETGAPLADHVDKTLFIPADEHAPTPNSLAVADDGTFYVASAFSGTIARYDQDGAYLDTLVEPPEGESFGPRPFSTGSPFGLAVAPDGSVYFADLGLGLTDEGVGTVAEAGTVRRIGPSGGPPEVMDRGLDYPDGIALYRP
jgi:sugar lactone lactonase YvrE